MSEFFNPYAFIPSSRHHRQTFPDEPPRPLGRLHPGCWTGRLRLSVVAQTPVLLTSVTDELASEHRVRATTRLPGSEDRADLLATSLKGMLRATYEAATDSRFGVSTSGARLTTRIPARDAQQLRLQPCRVGEPRDGCVVLEILPGDDKLAQAAAWVPRYFPCSLGQPHDGCCANIDPDGIRHGEKITALVARCVRPGKKRRDGTKQQPDITYWRVADVARSERELNERAARRRLGHLGSHRLRDPGRAVLRKITGWYAETGQNTENKHYERVFFYGLAGRGPECKAPHEVTLDPRRESDKRVLDDWAELIADYRQRHRSALEPVTIEGKTYRPEDYIPESNQRPARPAYSRHILDAVRGGNPPGTLPPGTLCYVQLDGDPRSGAPGLRAKALYPVAIARRVTRNSPGQLAAQQRLAPARRPEDASMADRVLGWAGARSRRGRVRIERCEHQPGSPAITPAGPPPGLPLAVLSAPKPQQHLFYSERQDGHPIQRGEEPYADGTALRGRKIYPAPARPDRYKRKEKERDGQNASLVDWVPQGAAFHVDVVVEDLTREELGALAWLLLPGRRHRLGLGKPLGFGTVSITIDPAHSMLRSGEQWADRYRLAGAADQPDIKGVLASAVTGFLEAVQAAWNGEEPRFLRALTRALEGFPADFPVRYPPDPDDPDSGTEQFKWFRANQQAGLALGDLAATPASDHPWWESMLLPVRPSAPEAQGRRNRAAGRDDGRGRAPAPGRSGHAAQDRSERGSAGQAAWHTPASRGSGSPAPDPRDIARMTRNQPDWPPRGGRDER